MDAPKKRRPGKGPIPRGGETARREAAHARRLEAEASGNPADRYALSLPYRGSVDYLERFWVRVAVGEPDACWPWLGPIDDRPTQGYGVARLHKTSTRAHRVAYELTFGVDLPRDVLGCHRCDNPPCCNPAHVFPGTARDNAQDCIAKGRAYRPTHCVRGHPRTEENLYPSRNGSPRTCRLCSDIRNHSKPKVERPKSWVLSPDVIPEIRARAAAGERHTDLAAAYGCSRRAIGMVVNGITWRHVA